MATNGDVFIPVEKCCIYHCPDDYDSCEAEIGHWVDVFKAAKQATNTGPEEEMPHSLAASAPEASQSTTAAGVNIANVKNHRVIDKTIMYPAACRIIATWVDKTWNTARKDNTLLPSSAFLPKPLQERLCSRMHTVTSDQKLRELLPEWQYFATHGTALVKVCGEVLTVFDALWKEHEEQKGEKKVEKEVTARIVLKIPTVHK